MIVPLLLQHVPKVLKDGFAIGAETVRLQDSFYSNASSSPNPELRAKRSREDAFRKLLNSRQLPLPTITDMAKRSPFFRSLPLELQDKIWEMSMAPSPCVQALNMYVVPKREQLEENLHETIAPELY